MIKKTDLVFILTQIKDNTLACGRKVSNTAKELSDHQLALKEKVYGNMANVSAGQTEKTQVAQCLDKCRYNQGNLEVQAQKQVVMLNKKND